MIKRVLTVLISWFIMVGFSSADMPVLRIPLHTSTISLDPSKGQDVSSMWVSRQINCQLVRMTKGISTFEAAESIHYSSPDTLDVKLKQNIYFTNGSEVTAEDVITTFNYFRKQRSVMRNLFSWIENMTYNGKYELSIKLKKSTPHLLTVLSAPQYAIFERNFILKVAKDPSLWKAPVSCGDYKIETSNTSIVKLIPANKHGATIVFSLVSDSQLLADDIDKYDLISMQVIGKSNSLSNFTLVNVFDPFQFYFILNTRVSPWNDRNARCAFFAKLNPKSVINVYGDRAKNADNFLPSGTLGYVKNNKYMDEILTQYKNTPLPAKSSVCVSFVASSIEKEYRPAYLEMIRNLYPNATIKLLNNYTEMNRDINATKCDGTFYAAKSNYLDAYEYFVPFAEKGPSATGYYDKSLERKILNSQDVARADIRAVAYHDIVKDIDHLCLMYPIFTIPYDIIYIRNSLLAIGIGDAAVNEYALSNVQLKNEQKI